MFPDTLLFILENSFTDCIETFSVTRIRLIVYDISYREYLRKTSSLFYEMIMSIILAITA